MTQIHVTEAGRRVALSGLLPKTATFLLAYLAREHSQLTSLLPETGTPSGDQNTINFSLLCAALMSPEFSGLERTRFIQYGFDVPHLSDWPSRVGARLAAQPWQAHRSALNAASLMLEWIDGAPYSRLEQSFNNVRAGTVEALCREVVWCLTGLADILAAATSHDVDQTERVACFRSFDASKIWDVRRLLPSIRLLAWRLAQGLPEVVLWLTETQGSDGRPLVSRKMALALYNANLGSYLDIRLRSNWAPMIVALRSAGISDAQRRAEVVQQLAMTWHLSLRDRRKASQSKRLGLVHEAIIRGYYDARGVPFEQAFEALLTLAGIDYIRFDQPPRQGAFDYALQVANLPDIPTECKSKQGTALVTLNEATDVLRAADLHGYAGANCVTVCQPGIDPNVPGALVNCSRLCVVEAHDLAEVLCQIALGRAAGNDLHAWLSQPGLATLASFLPVEP